MVLLTLLLPNPNPQNKPCLFTNTLVKHVAKPLNTLLALCKTSQPHALHVALKQSKKAFQPFARKPQQQVAIVHMRTRVVMPMELVAAVVVANNKLQKKPHKNGAFLFSLPTKIQQTSYANASIRHPKRCLILFDAYGQRYPCVEFQISIANDGC